MCYCCHQHPKDGEGNVFSLFVSPHLQGTPFPSHNISNGLMSFLGGTPVPAKIRWGTPWPGEDGVHPARTGRGTPSHNRMGCYPRPWQDGGMGYPPGNDRMGYPRPGQIGVTPPPPKDRLCLDWLWHLMWFPAGGLSCYS